MTEHSHVGACAACDELIARENASRVAAEAANRAKDDFSLTLSHELRGPLNAIMGWMNILRAPACGEELAARAVETIERNIHAQSRLIEDMLEVSRVISGKIRLQRCPVDLAALVAETAATLRPSANGCDIQVEEEERVGTVSADPDRLRQVIENLLRNAIKFTPRGGGIRVRLDAGAGVATIAVHDTGRGIRPDALPHLFERFWQAVGTPTRVEGLGLGLAIVRHLVELHGGTIDAKSEGEGHGATFTVTLPTGIANEPMRLGDEPRVEVAQGEVRR